MLPSIRRASGTLCLLSLATALGCSGGGAPTGSAEERVIYGQDDRRDPCTYPPDSPLRAWARSTAMEVPRASLLGDERTGFTLASTGTLAETMARHGMPLCPEERFRDQPSFDGVCTGFLAAPDVVITAGHCIDASVCPYAAFVFDVAYDGEGRDPARPGPDDIYLCAGVRAREKHANGPDFAIVKLDRPVVGRTPLPLRRAGDVAPCEELVLVGNPIGLPTKIAAGARVLEDDPAQPTFVADTDSYHGNSGSPVLGLHSGVVEGILLSGEQDFERKGSCWVSKVCPEGGAPCSGETVMRAPEIAAALEGGGCPGPRQPERSGPRIVRRLSAPFLPAGRQGSP